MIFQLLLIFIVYLVFKSQNICESYKSIGNLYLINLKKKKKFVNTKLSLNQTKLHNIHIININDILNNKIPENKCTGLVSIIVPVYNASKTIYDTIGSLINQTHRNIEIIVVDDNSTDDSLEKLQKIKDNRIKLYKNKVNYGTYKTINIGIKMSKGNYIILQGSDDYACIDRIKVLFDAIKNTNINMVYSNWIRGKKIKKTIEGNFMFKRHILKKMGFFDNTRFGGDSEFIQRYKMIYKKLKYVDDVLNIASIRNNSLTHTSNTYAADGILAASRQAYKKSIKIYHKNINQTKNYYMPFLHKKKIYNKYILKKKLTKNSKSPVEHIKDLYIDDIAYKIE